MDSFVLSGIFLTTIKDNFMAWDTTLTPTDTTVGNSTNNGVNDMADTVITQPADQGLFGGAGLGGLILGSMFARNGMFGAGADVAAARAYDTNAPVLQAITQNQANAGILQLVQDVNRTSHDVATSAADTQAAVAASTLSSVTSNMQGFAGLANSLANTNIANLEGQIGLQNSIHDVSIEQLNSHSNILSSISSMQHDVNANINNGINGIQAGLYQTQDQIQRASSQQIAATHQAEISGLQSSFALARTVTDEGEKTRALITSMEVANLNRALSDANNRVTELMHDNRTGRATSDIIINNNNNAVATANALAQQAQQQQIANLSSGLSTALAHLNSISQVSIATGRNNTITPNAVNV
jgi:hypothetical protein